MRKTVLITGVSGTIGEAIAIEFARNGYDIIGTYNKHQISQSLKLLCESVGARLTPFQLDMTNSMQVKEVFSRAFKMSEYLDCVVCNSGISLGEKMLCDATDEEINILIQTNLIGTIYCNREASTLMLERNYGNIVNMSSIYGVNGGSCESVYSASKGGIIALTKSLAAEIKNSNVRANAVAPGYIESNMTAHFTAEEKEEIRKKSPSKRLGQPEDVARKIYEISQSQMNGEIVVIN